MILSLSSLSLFLFPSLFLHSLTAYQKTRQLSLRAFKKRKAKDNFTHKLRKREKKKKIKIFLIFVMHAFSYWDQNQRIFYPRKNFEGKDLSPLLNQNTPQSYSHKTKKIRTTKLKIWTKKKKNAEKTIWPNPVTCTESQQVEPSAHTSTTMKTFSIYRWN